jgi:predicted DNA-binding transcriptional regulator YafY
LKLEKYIGRILRIVYVDKRGQITQRNIEVKAVVDGHIRAHCLKSKGPRVFAIENILAFEPVGARRHAG